jgi:poly(A) polymerase
VDVIPKIIPRAEHFISRNQIDKSVLDVLYTLLRSGYEAYLVGGGLRDLLLGLEPKDFDVVTNATPDQIKAVFRGRCRLIGRRFRLAHVHVGGHVIEVATFRAKAEQTGDRVVDNQGLLRRDNVYGTRDEDVWRRDFTINALYYNIDDFSIVDYVGAMDDLQQGKIRLIGDPAQRYREDPVRMIRAVRFACKLGLKLPEETAQPLPQLAHLLAEVSPARLYEEVLKLFHGGQAACVFEQLRQHGLFSALFDQTDYCLQQMDSWSSHAIPFALQQTDARVAEGKAMNPAFLFAVMMWEPLWFAMDREEDSAPHVDELLKEAEVVLQEQSERTSLPRPVVQQIKEIWILQLLLEQHFDKVQTALGFPRFRAALNFLKLRALVQPRLVSVVTYWESMESKHPEWCWSSGSMQVVNDGDDIGHDAVFESAQDESVTKKSRHRRRRKRHH